ncbi:hypothetical protein Hbl1158_10920 [Halobaculum sp. CBA1158]|uniref:hypothetical protein n=1 Tax=Halobaculum sp. CBA1158 TaxID=2904243 RepID=UPI001F18FD4A|nr:hypothetical protein [Halobaculum sp. CBA1158]UIO99043.1 hypothetical protein Hbl1158_10920 [Halobaculum sp. CBA1158]
MDGRHRGDSRRLDDDPDDALVRLEPGAAAAPGAYDIVDSVEEVRLPIGMATDDTRGVTTARRVDAADRFPAPVDGTWAVDATAVTPLCTADVYVRAPDNTVVATATAEAPARVPAGPHVLELSTAPVKTYVRVVGPARVSYADRYPRVSVKDPTDADDRFDGIAADGDGYAASHDGADPAGDGARILLGARSRRMSPPGTVTVPDGPAGVAQAISTFGSALATTSPERSFPTLRGHPPLIERGEKFDAPRFVERVDTGVTLGLPFEYGALYAATPLAFYLSATIEESDRPYLRAGEIRRDLPSDPDALSEALSALLRHCFTLDCATRACAVGLYDVELRVHEVLTERLDPPWEEWYEASLAERTGQYLTVPTTATLDCLDWPHTTDVAPAAENVSILPFLASDLSAVRSPAPEPETTSDGDVVELNEFVRASRDAVSSAALTRSAGEGDPTVVGMLPTADALGDGRAPTTRGPTQNATDDSDRVVTPREADSIAQSWVGPGFPMRAAKPTVEAYRRRLDRTPAEDLTIGVTVVCNDEAMVDELGDTYGFRDHVTFDIREELDLTVAELRDLLAEDHDFFHYVGHVDERGMECADGFLDLRTLESTGVDAFLLNACTSYRQGMGLVEAGALGGVVSLTDLPNSLATRVGRDLARLFDAGFPLYAALDVVGTGPFAGNAYSIVGDPLVQLCQCASGTPHVVQFGSYDDDVFEFVPKYYTTRPFGMGTMSNAHFDPGEVQYISSGTGDTIRIAKSELESSFSLGNSPIQIQGEIYWSSEVDLTDVLET